MARKSQTKDFTYHHDAVGGRVAVLGPRREDSPRGWGARIRPDGARGSGSDGHAPDGKARGGERSECVPLRDIKDSPSSRAWRAFLRRQSRRQTIPRDEIELLSRVSLMGEVYGPRDFSYILKKLRSTLAD